MIEQEDKLGEACRVLKFSIRSEYLVARMCMNLRADQMERSIEEYVQGRKDPA